MAGIPRAKTGGGPPPVVRRGPRHKSVFRKLAAKAKRKPGVWRQERFDFSTTVACGRMFKIRRELAPLGYEFTTRSRRDGGCVVFCCYTPPKKGA